MQLIIATIKQGQSGDEVANLQDALFVLLERKIIEPRDPERPTVEELQKLTELLKRERDQAQFGRATQQLVIYFQLQQGLGDDLRDLGVEEKTAAKLNDWLKKLGLLDVTEPNGFIIRGTVNTAEGQALAGAVVRAFDRDLRKEQPLGEAETSKLGQYVIRYGPSKFALGDIPSASMPYLIVRAFFNDQQLGNDVTRPKPAHDEVIDFIVPAVGQSEWERISTVVIPLLLGQGEGDNALPPWELNEQDLDFITEETGLDREQVRLWSLAFAVGRDHTSDLQPASTSIRSVRVAVPAAAGDLSAFAIFYGWFRLGLSSISLWTNSTETLITTATTAIAQAIVPSSISKELDRLRQGIEQIKLDRTLQGPAPGNTATLSDLLDTLPGQLNPDQKLALASVATELQPDDPQLVKRIAAVPGFDGDAIGVARTLRVGALTAGHLPLAEALQQRLQESDEGEGTLRPLASLRDDEWLDLAYTHGTPPDVAITPVAYAKELAASIEQQYPTAALAAHFAGGRRLGQHRSLIDVGTFLSANPSFDIVTANLNAIFDEKDLNGVAQPQQLVESLQMLQRMQAIGASWDETATLRERDLYSPDQILAAGPTQLRTLLAGQMEPERIEDLYQQTQELHDVAIGTFTSAFSPFSGPKILPNTFVIPLGGDPFPEDPNTIDPHLPPKPIPHTGDPTAPFELEDLVNLLETRTGGFDPSRYRFPPPVSKNPIPDKTPQVNFGPSLRNQPTLQSLFGVQDACACGHCSSVLSPAAYFVDVLQFLKNALPNDELLYRLFLRRPDLQDVELSCNNTNTVVPAIDLVMEALENAVAFPLNVDLPPGTDVEAQLNGSTVGPALKAVLERTVRSLSGEVSATKEGGEWTVKDGHRRWKIFAQTKEALTAGKQVLNTTNLNVPALIAALNQGTVPSEAQSALAQLFAPSQITPPDLTNYLVTITPLVPGKSWRVEYQFVADVEIGIVNLVLKTPADVVWWNQRYNQTTIAKIEQELTAGGVPELVKVLLTSHFYQATGLTIQATPNSGWKILSDKSQLTLTFTPAQLIVTSLAYQSGDEDADAVAWPENYNPEAYRLLKGPAAVFPWTLPLDLPLEEVRLFLERALSSRRRLLELTLPVDSNLQESNLYAREVLGLSEAESKLISEQSQNIYECWGLSAGQTMIWDTSVGGILKGASPLSLLQTVSILLQQSRLSFAELKEVLETKFVLGGGASLEITPHSTCKPSEMKIQSLSDGHLDRIHRFVRLQRRLNWSTEDLDAAIQIAGAGLNDASLRGLADLMRLGELLSLPTTTMLVWYATPPDDRRTRSLAEALELDGDELQHALRLFGISETSLFARPGETLKLCERAKDFGRSGISFEDLRYVLQHEEAAGSSTPLSKIQLEQFTGAVRDAVESVGELEEQVPPLPANDPERIATELAIRRQREDAVIAVLATDLDAGRELIDELLRNHLVHPSQAGQPALNVLLDLSLLNAQPGQPLNASVQTVLLRLYKTVFLCRSLKLGPNQLRVLRKSTADKHGLNGLDFNALPLAAAAAGTNVEGFERLLKLARLGQAVPRAADLLHHYAELDFAAAGLVGNAQQLLATSLALESSEISAAANALHITTAEQYRDPRLLIRLLELLTALKQLGATTQKVIPSTAPPNGDPNGLLSVSPNDRDADVARELLRKKYGEARWHDLIKPIADTLRERQRDALVDYLIGRDARPRDGDGNPQIFTGDRMRDANDLYERYLIDVQTGSCLKTTRLLQAVGAAQLFVQRVLLNLEKGVSLTDDKRELWDWMHTYRVWEANRKVFLFPENWLLPELRDDKTAIFREMESALTEGEATTEIAEVALQGYLESLDELAQITVISMYEDRRKPVANQEPERTLYVVGRTPNQPFRYFWRSCSKFGDAAAMYWSGWEALDIDNANDFLMPFIFDGDLHVAWPVFQKKVIDLGEDQNPNKELQWDVQIAWTRRTGERWIKRKIGDESLVLPRLINKTEFNSFCFRLRTDGENDSSLKGVRRESVYIDCYTAEPEKADPAPINFAQLPNNLLHFGNPVSLWVNVNLVINIACLGHFELNGVDIYEYLNDVQVTVDYQYGYWGGGVDIKQTTARVNGFISIALTVQNNRKVKVKLVRGGDSKSLDKDMVEDGGEYGQWVWNISEAFEITESTHGDFNPNRQVIFKNAGYFLMDTLHDISAVRKPSNEALPIALKNAKVNGNGFTLDAPTDQLPLPPNHSTKLDKQPVGPLTLVPAVGSGEGQAVWYVKDSSSRYYVDARANATLAWPDGQDFVRSYRRLRALAKFNELFDPTTQAMGRDGLPVVAAAPPPAPALNTSVPAISFNRATPYANYNWELFLHTPLAIADSLASQMRFADARRWLHAVFDPTTDKKDKKTNQISQFWRFLPFDNASQPEAIATLLTWLSNPTAVGPKDTAEIENKLKASIDEWKKNPFMPHLVARLRPSAYQWYTFFAYLDLLIGWADQLFRRDTRESVNEATLLYVLAAKLLGPRPRTIPSAASPPAQTYRSLQASGTLDNFSNAWVSYADLPGTKRLAKRSLPVKAASQGSTVSATAGGTKIERPPKGGHLILTSLSGLAFCVPQNDKLTEFYDRVEERLFNIRHCRNIDGVVRELPLYDPPIDPLLLIRARAAGLDLTSVVAGQFAPLPNYRFTFTLQKALELCAELKTLGSALLSALEKQDAEEMALLRSRHEISMLKLVRDIRQKQIEEAEANIVALQQSEETVLERFAQYQKLLGKPGVTKGQDGLPVVEQSSSLVVSTDVAGEASGLGLSRTEVMQLMLSAIANNFTLQANSVHVLAGILSMFPDVWGGNAMVSGSTFGGSNLGSGLSAAAKAIEMGAAQAGYFAGQMGTFASYERRQDEWVHQSRLALAELKQIQKQKLAAEIRKAIAERELDNHDAQIENALEVEEFMKSKFTSKQLYRWMSSQIAQVYFRTYQLALDQARRAERAFQYELGLSNKATPFVQINYWDSLKGGLLAGEHLHHDLKRMEGAYLERNVREFEITKHISLLQLDPAALIALKETGTCVFDIPEVLFDLDHPGHYLRRLKMVSLSIPCVVGPYAGVNATLRLTKSETRIDRTPPTDSKPYGRAVAGEDPRFVSTAASITAVVTSNAQQDSGMFEPNLRDERYLPFEGEGVISSWRLELPATFRSFDYGTISDVILHFRYTARDGGDPFKDRVVAQLNAALNQIVRSAAAQDSHPTRLFSVRHEFPTEWYRFLNPAATKDGHTLEFELSQDRFPFPFRDRTILIRRVDLFLKFKGGAAEYQSSAPLALEITPPGDAPVPKKPPPTPPPPPLQFDSDNSVLNGLPHALKDFVNHFDGPRKLGSWSLTIAEDDIASIAESLRRTITASNGDHLRLNAEAVEDLFLVFQYSI